MLGRRDDVVWHKNAGGKCGSSVKMREHMRAVDSGTGDKNAGAAVCVSVCGGRLGRR